MNFIDFIDAEISRYFIDADKEEEEETNFQNLKTSIKKSKIVEDSLDMIIFFKFVLQISNNHRRCTNFFDKIKPIIGFFVDDIKKNFSNSEIFEIFRSNNTILLFLVENQIVTLDDSIISKIDNELDKKIFCSFFSKTDDPDFNRKRKEGEK